MNYVYNAYHHFLTITKHKCEVMKNCFAVGLYRQGLLHDLSKYSWEEFATGVKYYQGEENMRQINLVEGKVVAPEGMKVGIVAARFNEIIVNKLLGGACFCQ